MKPSRRHHYIPQFLIRQFAGDDGLLYVYDKEKDLLWKDRKGARAIFFEMNRNTLPIGGTPSDDMEKLYAELDNHFSQSLEDLLTTRNVSPENVLNMQLLISLLKWRIPLNDELFRAYTEKIDYDDLPIKVVRKDTGEELDKNALRHLLQSDIYKASQRILFSFLHIYEGKSISEDKLLANQAKSYLHYNENTTAILGDSPFIESEDADIHHLGSVIFPLNNTNTFVCSDNGRQKINNGLFYANRDILIFHQSRKYIVCKDKEYLQLIRDMHCHASEEGELSGLQKLIFTFT